MIISYIFHSSFKIKTDLATLITDPFDNSVGKIFPKQEADVVTITHNHQDHANKSGIKNDNCVFIDAPGEYEVKEIMIRGINTFHDDQNGTIRGKNTIYYFQAEGINICHLGDLGHDLSDSIIKEIEMTDVLMIPIGGIYTIGPAVAAKIVRKIEPSVILPMHYKTNGISEKFSTLSSLNEFCEKLGLEAQTEEKLNIHDNTLPEEMILVNLLPRA